jgi:hypothetical protein
MSRITSLHRSIAAVCPIRGVSVVDPSDKATWRIDFDPSATEAQMQAARAALQEYDPNAPVVPQEVTALQARRALRAAGLYDTVKAAVDAAPDPDVRDSWESTAVWHRDAMWIDLLGAQLDLSPQQIDALFVQAASL